MAFLLKKNIILWASRIAPLMLLSANGHAASPSWNIVPEKSQLTFTAVQNGAPVSGTFPSFSGDIHFDPSSLADSHVRISIDLASVVTSYGQVADTLKTSDWFDTSHFPQAIFQANRFTKKADNLYEGQGTLTMRNKTVPTSVTFSLNEYSPTHALVKGNAVLKRTSFGVGQGEWADTNAIKDDVNVDFILDAVPDKKG